ncbi:MAG: AsmA family protein, partial [bacterium]
LGRPVQVSGVSLRVIPRLSLEIRGLRIMDPPEFGGKPALTAESLRGHVRILPLLQRRLDIRSIRLYRPVLVLRRDSAGFNNLFGPKPSPPTPEAKPTAPEPAAPSPPTEAPAESTPLLAGFLIGNLDIEGAEFRIEDPKVGAPISLRGISLSVRQPSPESVFELRLQAESPAFRMKAEVGPLDWNNHLATPLEVEMVIGKGWLQTLQPWLRRRLSGSRLQLTGGNLSGEIRLRGNLLNRGEIKWDLSLRKIQGRIGSRPLNENPKFDIHLKSRIKVSRPNAQAPSVFQADGDLILGDLLFKLTGRGTRDPEGLRFETEVQAARIQGSDLLPLLQAALGDVTDALQLAGLVGFNVKVRGGPNKTSTTLTLQARSADVRYGTVFRKSAGVPLKLAGTLVTTPERLEVKSFSLDLRHIRLRGELRQSDGVLHLRSKTDEFNLEGLDTLFPGLEPWALAGKTRIGVIANGRLEDILQRRIQVQLTLEDGAASLPGRPTRIRNLQGFILVTPRSVQVSRARARMGKSQMELEARLIDFHAPRIRFELRASTFRLKDFLPPRPPSPRKSTTSARPPLVRKASWAPRGPFRSAAAEPERTPQSGPPAASILKRIQAEGSIRIGKGEAGGVHFQNLFAELRLQEGKLFAERLKADLYGGAVEGSGEYGLDRQPASFRGRLALKDIRVEKALADHVSGPPLMSGRANLDAEFQGVGVAEEELKRSLSAKGSISITNGEIRMLKFLGDVERGLKMKGIFGLQKGKKRFERFSGPFEIRKGKVILPDLRMISPGLSLRAKGEVGLNLRSRLTVTAVFDEKASRRLSRGFLGAFIRPGERFEVPFRVQGPLTAPRVSLDPRFLERSLRRDPVKFLRDTLRRLLR